MVDAVNVDERQACHKTAGNFAGYKPARRRCSKLSNPAGDCGAAAVALPGWPALRINMILFGPKDQIVRVTTLALGTNGYQAKRKRTGNQGLQPAPGEILRCAQVEDFSLRSNDSPAL